MRKSTFLKHIEALDEEGLREEMMVLFTKLDAVKQYYKMELGSEKDRSKLYAASKKEITAKFATKSFRKPRRPRIQKINSIIKAVEELSIFSHELIDIYLFCVETSINFIDTYEFYSQVLENFTVKQYNKALASISENNMETDFEKRLAIIDAKIRRLPLVKKAILMS